MCSAELRSLVSSLEYLVSNERQVLLGDIRLGGSATMLYCVILKKIIYGPQIRALKSHFNIHWHMRYLVIWPYPSLFQSTKLRAQERRCGAPVLRGVQERKGGALVRIACGVMVG